METGLFNKFQCSKCKFILNIVKYLISCNLYYYHNIPQYYCIFHAFLILCCPGVLCLELPCAALLHKIPTKYIEIFGRKVERFKESEYFSVFQWIILSVIPDTVWFGVSNSAGFILRDVLEGWGSGTGAAGVTGSLLYAGLIQAQVSPETTLLIMLIVPVAMLVR